MEETYKKRRFKQTGIRWKMLSIFLVFILLFALMMWVFQIQMLNYFYQAVKYNEFEKIVELISNSKGDTESIEQIILNHSDESYDDIWIYKLSNGNEQVVDGSILFDDVHDNNALFLEKEFGILYNKTKLNGGRYVAVFSDKYFQPDSYFEFKILTDNSGDKDFRPIDTSFGKDANVIQLDIVNSSSGDNILIIQKASLAPTNALINTIEAQVIFVTVFLVIFAIILVIVFSRIITKPIVNMNESAKKLAEGKYDIEFKGKNYREISELSDTLNYAAKELSKNDLLQKELISNISHDLRTPLTMIRGYSELMRDIPEENNAENFQIIIDEAARLSELVNAMLDLSKIQAGVRVPQMQIFSLTETINGALSRYEKLIEQDNYKIEFVAGEEIFVCADSGMILQVVYNFINNAINYTGADKYVRVEQTLIKNKVRISVIDTGEGIPEDKVPYIWDRYYKVDKVHRRATVGSGLGLSIVKSVLEAHGASYGVVTGEGKGSTFWFELDVAAPKKYDETLVKH